MIIKRVLDVEPETFAEGVQIRWVFSRKKDGVPNFSMRHFTLKKGALIKLHSHDWEHEIYMIRGKLRVKAGDDEAVVGSGYAVYVPPNKPHSFEALEDTELLCFIPCKGEP